MTRCVQQDMAVAESEKRAKGAPETLMTASVALLCTSPSTNMRSTPQPGEEK